MTGDTVAVGTAGGKELGVFSLKDFRPGDLILRFEPGRTVHVDQLATLSTWEQDHLGELTEDTCQILPPPRCYVNHACVPNAVSTSSELRALRDIRAGEEITIDYRLNSLDDWEMACACGADGELHTVIGNFFTLPDHLQRRYLPDAPPFVQKAYRRRHGLPHHR